MPAKGSRRSNFSRSFLMVFCTPCLAQIFDDHRLELARASGFPSVLFGFREVFVRGEDAMGRKAFHREGAGHAYALPSS